MIAGFADRPMSAAGTLTLRAFSPSDPPRIAARADFEAEHRAMGEPLFGPERPAGPCWTLTDGGGRWARPLACGGLDPQGHGRFAAWLYAADLSPRGWVAVRRAFREMVKVAKARRVEVTVRAASVHQWPAPDCPRAAFALSLGLSWEGRMRAFGPDGSDYLLFAGVF